MSRKAELLLEDIQRCIDHIGHYTAGLSLEDYLQNDLVRDAVERNFITIGEAIRRLNQASSAVSERIAQSVRISGFRNILVHEYEQVDNKQVWGVVKVSLPVLKQQIDAWAAELGMEVPPKPAS